MADFMGLVMEETGKGEKKHFYKIEFTKYWSFEVFLRFFEGFENFPIKIPEASIADLKMRAKVIEKFFDLLFKIIG